MPGKKGGASRARSHSTRTRSPTAAEQSAAEAEIVRASSLLVHWGRVTAGDLMQRMRALPKGTALLQTLRVTFSGLESLPVDLLTPAQCPALTELELSYAALRELPPSMFGETACVLRELCVSNNLLRTLPDTLARAASTLVTLSLRENELRELPECVYALTQLRSLDFAYNQVERIGASVRQLRALEYVNAEWNCLRTLPADLATLPLLRRIELVGNCLEELPAALLGLPAVQPRQLSTAASGAPSTAVRMEAPAAVGAAAGPALAHRNAVADAEAAILGANVGVTRRYVMPTTPERSRRVSDDSAGSDSGAASPDIPARADTATTLRRAAARLARHCSTCLVIGGVPSATPTAEDERAALRVSLARASAAGAAGDGDSAAGEQHPLSARLSSIGAAASAPSGVRVSAAGAPASAPGRAGSAPPAATAAPAAPAAPAVPIVGEHCSWAASAPTARSYACACTVVGVGVLVAGGSKAPLPDAIRPADQPSTRAPVAATEMWRSADNVWMSCAPLPRAVAHASVVCSWVDGRPYLVGGDDGTGEVGTTLRYNVDRDFWAPVASLEHARSAAQLVAVPDGRLFSVGGATRTCTALDSVEWYDARESRWRVLAEPLPEARSAHVAQCVNDCVLVTGGRDASGALCTGSFMLDLRMGRWYALPGLAVPRAHAASTVLDGHMFVLGGELAGGAASAAVERFSFADREWRLRADLALPTALIGCACAPIDPQTQ